jgi:hypothetical protein
MTHDKKLALIQEQISSGLTQAEFCAKKSINLPTFRQWKYRRAKSKVAMANHPYFVELIPMVAPDAPAIVSICSGQFRIDGPQGFDRVQLRAILESIPC